MIRLLCTFFLSHVAFILIAQNKIDVLHYKFSIELNDINDTIYGHAEIKFRLLSPVSSLKLDLKTKDESGKGMLVDKITGTGIRGFVKSKDSIQLKFFPVLLPTINDTITFIITYHGIPSDGLIISKNQYGKRTFFGDNWPNRAHHWIPCVDDPADKASVEFIVTAPAHYQVVSNGIQIEETNLPGNKKLTHWKEDVPLPTKVMVIGVADFAVNYAGNVDCVPVYSWVYPENKKEGFYDYEPAKEILSYHKNYIGDYPYKKLANVQSKTVYGGMENANAIFYAEQSVTGSRQEDELMSHEIVHQWFGNMATEKSFAHLWLSEGFATYLTHIFVESKYGTDSLNKEMQYDRESVLDFVNSSKRPVVDSTTNYMSLLNDNSYKKGSWVLHMLRRQLGDTIFKKSIRHYYATFAGKNADSQDLQKIFEEISGKDLSVFFQQWLYRGENPKLDIAWKYNTKDKSVTVIIKQLQKSNFHFPIDIYLEEPVSKPKTIRKVVTNTTETFIIPVIAKPARLQIDPDISLLYEGNITELK